MFSFLRNNDLVVLQLQNMTLKPNKILGTYVFFYEYAFVIIHNKVKIAAITAEIIAEILKPFSRANKTNVMQNFLTFKPTDLLGQVHGKLFFYKMKIFLVILEYSIL